MPTRYLVAACVAAVCSIVLLMYFYVFASTTVPRPPAEAVALEPTPASETGSEAALLALEQATTTEASSTDAQELSVADADRGTGVSAPQSSPQSGTAPAVSTPALPMSGQVGAVPKPQAVKPTPSAKPTEGTNEDTEDSGDEDEDEQPTHNSSPTPSPAPPAVETSGTAKWGVYVGYSAGELAAFEQLVGQAADIRGVFVNWDDPFPSSFSSLKSSGKTLLIYWELYGGVTLDSIIAGEHDAYIKEFARGAQSYGGQVILAPMHEMNGNWDPWGGTVGSNTPEKVVATWKRIHDTFGSVSNVKFGWAVNSLSVPNTPANALERYYPGDAYVDYVGVDGFNFGSPWESFDAVFADSLTRLEKYHKPIYIFSMASAEGPQKDEWIRDFAQKIATKYDIAGWVWFNEDKERDWRVNSDADSLAAFKAILP